MNMMKNKSQLPILLIGAKGGSVSEGLLKCLRLAKYENITLLEYSLNAAHLYRVEHYVIFDKTPNDGDEFIDGIINLCLDKGIQLIIPGSTWEAKILAENIGKFEKSGLVPLVNNIETIKIGDDKWNTFKHLSNLNIGTPETFKSIADVLDNSKIKFPIIVKPRRGRGSQNIFLVENQKELQIICEYFDVKNIQYIIQEFISGKNDEYTVGVISDKRSNVIQSIVMQRLLMGGATGFAKVHKRGFINDFCEDIAGKLNSTGPVNIQLRLNSDNQPLVFEINPRFSGSAPMRALAGFNEPDMIIENFFYNEDIMQRNISYGNVYFRAFQEIEVPFDKDKGQLTSFL